MADSRQTITYQFRNNSGAATTTSKSVPQVVVDNKLVPDFRQFNPGVIQDGTTGVNTDGSIPLPTVDGLR